VYLGEGTTDFTFRVVKNAARRKWNSPLVDVVYYESIERELKIRWWIAQAELLTTVKILNCFVLNFFRLFFPAPCLKMERKTRDVF
jgi:hypothetical protein